VELLKMKTKTRKKNLSQRHRDTKNGALLPNCASQLFFSDKKIGKDTWFTNKLCSFVPLRLRERYLGISSKTRKKNLLNVRNIGNCFFVFLLAGCTSLLQKGGEVLEGSAFTEKTTALYSSDRKEKEVIIELKEMRNKEGDNFIEITSSQWPGLALRGSVPDADGGFHLTEAIFLSPHASGWNEFNYSLLGSGNFTTGREAGGVLRIEETPERIQISSGKIRLKSRRLTGNAALVPLRNRRERILALTEWMTEWQKSNGASAYFDNQAEFEEYWRNLLFPELVSAEKRPDGYSSINTGNAEWNRADGVKWNAAYTRSLFPEALWEFRNSGALLRDWEEALPWIFMEYSWNKIIGSFNNTSLQKIK
jgi:hypothetical protein